MQQQYRSAAVVVDAWEVVLSGWPDKCCCLCPFFNFYIIVSMYGNEVVSSMLLCVTNHRVHDSMLTFSITDYICKFSKLSIKSSDLSMGYISNRNTWSLTQVVVFFLKIATM